MQAQPSSELDVQRGGTVIGSVRQAPGGVGRNITHALALCCRGVNAPVLVSVVGQDPAGQAFLYLLFVIDHITVFT